MPSATDAAAPDVPAAPPDLGPRLLVAQVQMLHERTRASGWTSVLSALLVCALLWGTAPHALLVGWLAIKLALFALRVSVADRRGREADGAGLLRWRNAFCAVVIADGLAWGLGFAVFTVPLDSATKAVLLSTLIAVASVAGMVLSIYTPLHLGFSAGVVLPPAAAHLAAGGALGWYIGIGLLVFQGFLWLQGRTVERQTTELLRLRLLLEHEARERALALALAERHGAVKSQFLATMSHEMRTPLHGILGLARQLRDGDAAPASREQARGLIERSGEHLLGLINDTLDFAKIEAGHMRLDEQPFDLVGVIEEVVALSGAGAHAKALSVDIDTDGLGPTGGWMRGDAARVRQVLHNLMGNAVKFTERGRISVRAARDAQDGWVVVEVEDTGAGIAPEQLERVFDAFHQGEGTFNRRYVGTGLGLTIGRELARAMGGELSARSTPGRGSVFCLRAPLPPALPDTLPPPDDEPAAAPPLVLRGRVLVAEDNPVNALVVEAMLRQFGIEVERADDGAQAVENWERHAPDLVLMDCQMPVMDGFAATRAIREREARLGRRRVTIVALTANAYDSDRERCFAAGMDEHLAKPFRDDELCALLARHLDAVGGGVGAPPLDLIV